MPAHPLMHAQTHAHGHTHAHTHTHTHVKAHSHVHEHVPDLKSPVLTGLAQRLLWVASLLLTLWLVVFWALRING